MHHTLDDLFVQHTCKEVSNESGTILTVNTRHSQVPTISSFSGDSLPNLFYNTLSDSDFSYQTLMNLIM